MMEWIADILRFADQGGVIIRVLMPVAVLMWFLIIERYCFIYISYPQQHQKLLQQWLSWPEKRNWYGAKVREQLVSENRARLQVRLSTIATLIAICPLLGLLGTVTGMISVFDTIALTGTSDARAMADGIYRATLPTMAGLVLALSALYCHHQLQQKARRLADVMDDQLGASQAVC